MTLDEVGLAGDSVQDAGGDWPLVQDTVAPETVPHMSAITVTHATILPLAIFVPFQ